MFGIVVREETWANVYHPALGGIAGVIGDIGTDTAGNVYAVGRRVESDGSSVAVVQTTGDQGANWTVLDHYAEAGLPYAHHRAFAADPANTNHLFAGGNLNGIPGFGALWHIRERNPVTGVWFTAEDYSALVNDVGQASCADILATPTGDVYATGGGQLAWLVRKRPAGGSTFTTVDVDYSGQTPGAGWDLAFHTSYGVFAIGDVNGIWTVRRSSTGNKGTWTTVDSFYTPREWTGGSAKCILATPTKIHVVGSAYKWHFGNHWVVRSSSDGGLTWSITDDLAPTYGAEARGIAQDASGNLVVCGYVDTQWIVRKGILGTKLVKQGKQWVSVETLTWTTIDAYQLAPGKAALPSGIAIDGRGNIFVGGYAKDAAGVDYWIVRKLAEQ